MDFSLNDEDRRFQDDLRAYLEREFADREPPRDRDARRRWDREVAARLADDGYAMPAWPSEWGGMELSLTQQYVYHREFARIGLRPHPDPNVGLLGPTLIMYGTDEQKHRFLPPLLRAEELWAQGFSEPEAGSDLPALRTRAVRDGDHYVVNGQKVWTSRAHVADWIFALVRTGSQEERERGISYLLIDLSSEGIEIRPLVDLTGGTHFSEVFFNDVRVPVQNRVGEENGGWAIARTTLGHERSAAFVSRALRYRKVVDELLALARARGQYDDPLLRQDLADLEIRVRLLALNGLRVLSNVVKHGEPGPTSSISRLFYATFEQRLHEVAVEMLGSEGLMGHRDSHAVQGGRWTWGFLNTRASTIGAGTSEIQRNTIAERVLQLPREPRHVPA